MKRSITFTIEGMTCAVCSGVCERALIKVEGVNTASVNLASKKASVVFNDELTSTEQLGRIIDDEGYSAIFDGGTDAAAAIRRRKQLWFKIRLIIALCDAFALLYIAMSPMVGLPALFEMHSTADIVTEMMLATLAMGLGYHFYIIGFRALLRLKPNMDTLVALGTTASMLFSVYNAALLLGNHAATHKLYFESVSVIIALVMLGKYLESSSVEKAGGAVRSLLGMTPSTATVLRSDFEESVHVSEVTIGDVLIARPGDAIAVDGDLTKGSTEIDESMLTGESALKEKSVGDAVYAGTINRTGMIAYRAVSMGKDTVLSKIVSIVEQAQGSKAPVARLADKIASVFVPSVAVVALIAFFWWWMIKGDFSFGLNIFVSVLVIACPCALGLATPAAIITGNGKAAQLGILFKSAESLETLSKVDTVVFDKTGTLTVGKPQVKEVFVVGAFSRTDVLAFAAAAETGSTHPLAEAIRQKASELGIDVPKSEDHITAEGRGVEAELVDGRRVKVGNVAYFDHDATITAAVEQLIKQGYTVVVITVDAVFTGMIALSDALRPESKSTLKTVSTFGVKTIMLTGDNARVAAVIGAEAGISDIIADVLPTQKADIVADLCENHTVAMVGDGINDAPALIAADVGIAVDTGTDIAVDSADIVLTGNGIAGIADAVALSKKTMRNIRQNLFWAFFYNIIGIPVAAGALYPFFGLLLSPEISALAMSFSSVSVVLNALRLNLYKSVFQNK